MADIALGILGLATTAEIVFKRIYRYVQGVKNAEHEVVQLSLLVNALYGTLQGLSLITGEFESEGAVSQVYGAQISACHAALDRISRKLASFQSSSPSKGTHRAVRKAWKWPFSRGETLEIHKELQSHQAALSFALTVEGLATTVSTLRTVQSIGQSVAQVKDILESRIQIESSLDNDRLLSLVAPHSPRHHLRTNLKLRHPGTGIWFLQGRPFQRWLAINSAKLWIHGIPGAGKSVLAACSISHAFSEQVPEYAIAYFFCDYKLPESLRSRAILGSVVEQLARQNKACFSKVADFVSHHSSGDRLQAFACESGQLIELLGQMAANFDELALIVDGVDECGEFAREVLGDLQILENEVPNLKMMVFSRDIYDVRDFLEDWDTQTVAAQYVDLSLYVASEVATRTDKRARKRLWVEDSVLKGEIIERLVDGANGMFRWVALQLDHFCDLASDAEIRHALGSLPPGLHESYERLLSGFIKKPMTAQLVIQRALQWVITIGRLPPHTLGDAIALESDNESSTAQIAITDDRILALCGGLLRKSEDDKFLESAHFTVKEFLLSDKVRSHHEYKIFALESGSPDSRFAVAALRCLLQLDIAAVYKKGLDSEARLKKMDEQNPLRAFIRNKWHHWVAAGLEDPKIFQLTRRLFEPSHIHTLRSFIAECCTCNTLGTMIGMKDKPESTERLMEMFADVDSFTPCHFSAILGFYGICQTLLESEYEADDISPEGVCPPLLLCVLSPLILTEFAAFPTMENEIASMPLIPRLEHTALVLTEHGPRLRPGATWFQPRVLDMLILLQFKTICQQVLKDGTICDRSNLKHLKKDLQAGGSAMKFAQSILMSMSKENVRPADEQLLTDLQAAGEVQHEQSSEFGGDIAVSTDEDAPQAAVIESIKSDDPATLPSLLKDGQSLQSWRDDSGCGLLDMAIRYSAFQVAKSLIAEGLSVDLPNNADGVPPLHIAARYLRPRLLELLYDNGADMAIIGKEGRNICHAISSSSPVTARGSSELQTCIRAIRAKVPQDQLASMVDKCDDSGMCPLSNAIRCCNDDAVRALLDMGADEWALGPQGKAMIHHAAASGSSVLVRLFLKRGHSPSLKDNHGAVALAHAAAADVPDAWPFLALYDASPISLLTGDHDFETPLDILFKTRGGFNGCVYFRAFEEIVGRLVEAIIPEASGPLFQYVLLCRFKRESWFRAAAVWLEELEGADLGQLGLLQIPRELTRLLDLLQEFHDEDDTETCEAIARMTCPLIRYLPEDRLRPVRSKGKQILTVAITTNSQNVAMAILDAYVDVKTPDDDDDANTPLQSMTRFFVPSHIAQKILFAAGDLSDAPRLSSGFTLLSSAVRYAPLSVITALVEGGQNVNCLNASGMTPLMAVSQRTADDYLEVFDFLLSEGADPRLKDCDSFTAAHEAVYHGKLPILERLAKVKHCWEEKCMLAAESRETAAWNLLQLAAFRGHVDVVEYLLGLDLFDLDEKAGDLSLLDAAAIGGSTSVVFNLLQLDREWGESTDLSTPLHYAMTSGRISTMRLLLQNGYDLYAKRNDGVSPLSLALRRRDTDVTTFIEDYIQSARSAKDETFMRNAENISKLMMQHKLAAAISEGDTTQCRTLLRSGIPLQSACTNCGHCDPLVQALETRKEDVALVLIENGVSLSGTACEMTSHPGWNTLQLCAFAGLMKAMTAILDRCPWLLFVQCNAHPVHLAILSRERECLQTMLERSAKLWTSISKLEPQASGSSGREDGLLQSTADARKYGSRLLSSPDLTAVELAIHGAKEQLDPGLDGIPGFVTLPLHHAVFVDDMEALSVLLENGADVDQASAGGCYTPLHVAIRGDNGDAVEKLIAASANTQLCDEFGISCQRAMLARSALQDFASPELALDGPATDIYGWTIRQHLQYSPSLWRVKPSVRDESLTIHNSLDWKMTWESLDYLLNAGLDIASTTTAFGGILHSRWTDIDANNVRNICKRIGPDKIRQHLNSKPQHRFSPLYYAVIVNGLEVAKVFLRFGADPNFVGGPEGSALMAAAAYGRLEMFKLLIYAGAMVSYRDTEESEKIFSAYQRARHFPKIQRWLLVERWTEMKPLTWVSDDELPPEKS